MLIEAHPKAKLKPKYKPTSLSIGSILDGFTTRSLEFVCNCMVKSTEKPFNPKLLTTATRCFNQLCLVVNVLGKYGNSMSREVGKGIQLRLTTERDFITLVLKLLKCYEPIKLSRSHLDDVIS